MDKIKSLRELIHASDYTVFFGGAGVSTESGVPDFRSDTGIYKTADRGRASCVEELLHINFFRAHPREFYEFYRKYFFLTDIKPNAAHYALSRLEEAGGLRAVITQNIDSLHTLAGSKNVIELHGSNRRFYCERCAEVYTFEQVLHMDTVPLCSRGHPLRPDIVFYGEALPRGAAEAAAEHIRRARLLIVAGTSLTVYPAAGYLSYFRGEALVLINKAPTPYDSRAQLVIHDGVGAVLSQICPPRGAAAGEENK